MKKLLGLTILMTVLLGITGCSTAPIEEKPLELTTTGTTICPTCGAFDTDSN